MALRANQMLFLGLYLRRRRRMRTLLIVNRRSRRSWSSDVFVRRDLDGWEATLLPTLQRDSIYSLSDFLRVDESIFNLMLDKLKPRLTKNSRRPSIPPRLRLLITLSFLASGSSYHQLRFVLKSTIGWTFKIRHFISEPFSWSFA